MQGFLEDLAWFGMKWAEGPDVGGPHEPYHQSQRMDMYRDAFERLRAAGYLYPCTCSRKDIMAALSAPHQVCYGVQAGVLLVGNCANFSDTLSMLGRPLDGARIQWCICLAAASV